MSEIFGYILSLFIGISTGLIGAGGSILSLPILVYLFKIDAVSATAYSLIIVSLTSGIASTPYIKRKQFHKLSIYAFGIPSIISIILTRKFILSRIPDVLYTIGNFTVYDNTFLMSLFAFLMIGASYNMIKKTKEIDVYEGQSPTTKSIISLLISGILVGVLAGLVGAGGGFMIIPVLVLIFRIPMKMAVGTSLIIITINSLFGFLSFRGLGAFNWKLVVTIMIMAIIGIFIGTYLSTKVKGSKLKRGFGIFILLTGIYILFKEVILKIN